MGKALPPAFTFQPGDALSQYIALLQPEFMDQVYVHANQVVLLERGHAFYLRLPWAPWTGPVPQAFAEIGYSGTAIAELAGGDEAYLRDVSRRIDRLLLGRS